MPSHPLKLTAAGLLLAAAAALPGVAAAQDATLPGGATELSERYRDWTVTCHLEQQPNQFAVRRCAVSQQQVNGQGQRVLTVELQPGVDGTTGVMVLPFGLELSKGIALAVDDVDVGQSIAFSTCLPAGCLGDVKLNADTLGVLRAGEVLGVQTYATDGQDIDFSISLAGFSSAYDRVAALMN